MPKVAIIGATGYTGEELVNILGSHPKAEITSLSAKIDKPDKISKIFPRLAGKCDLVCGDPDIQEVKKKSEVVFLALPHTISMEIAPDLLKAGKKVIDLSADYRLPADIYHKWYGTLHKDMINLRKAVYGLPELYRKEIKRAQLIANPGCYPTSIILGLAPFIKEKIADLNSIVADSKSGTTGAGRKASLTLLFSEVNESVKPYKVDSHQHSPEINDILSKVAGERLEVIFVPHVVPLDRGILTTLYLKLKKSVSNSSAVELYKRFYANEPFVEITEGPNPPHIKDVVGTNFCRIWVKVNEKKKMAIVVSVIDNLLKGAAGQAVQNMNIMYGFDERMGLV